MKRLCRSFIASALVVASLLAGTEAVSAVGPADLSVAMSVDKDKVKVGETVVYTLTVTNHGPETADNVWIGLTVGDDLNPQGTSCSLGTAGLDYCEGITLTNEGTAVARMTVSPGWKSKPREQLAQASGYTYSLTAADPQTGNNSASITIMVVGANNR